MVEETNKLSWFVSCHITLNLQVAKALEITAIIVQTL